MLSRVPQMMRLATGSLYRLVAYSPRHAMSQSLLMHARQLCDISTQPIIFNVSTAEEFQEQVLESSIPVIVDFHANWCGPCKMLGPRLEQKIQGRGGQILMAKVDIDEAAELAMDYQVGVVPTVLAFHGGEVVTSFQGTISDEEIDQFLDQAIEGTST
ncbi:unnamed protein product, partial [Mesorhabditis belari]|uniref:Thioredoxin domain-containing protein n=1 Tax=Mesorhabditis belari TaxID=2138241 RepID=A0AAF3FCT3_9BILA